MLTAVIALLAGLIPALPSATPTVTLVHVIEGETGGRLVAVDSGMVTLRRDGRMAEVPVDTVREMRFRPVDAPSLPPPFTVWDLNGNRLDVRRMGGTPSTVELTGYGWTARGVSLGALRAVATRRMLKDGGEAAAAFQRAREDRDRARDVVVAQTEDGVRTVSCIVTGFSSEGVRASIGGEERTAGWDRCAGVVLSAAAATGGDGRRHHVTLEEGTAFGLESFSVADGLLKGRTGPAQYTVECSRLSSVRVASESYAYLSDLPVESAESVPQLDVVWPHRLDRCVTGAPLRLGGVEYGKGIGMHPRTALSFRNTGGFDRLLAVVGVDDAAGDRGSVKFIVRADGRLLLERGPLTGADAPEKIDADVDGARLVTVAVEPGDPLVLSGNLADWCDVRLVKARAASEAGPGDAVAR